MRPVTDFYAAFQRAGFLARVEWASQTPGAATVEGWGRFTRQHQPTFEGAGQALQSVLVLPASALAGLATGDAMRITEPDGTVHQLRVFEHRLITGGTQREITFKR